MQKMGLHVAWSLLLLLTTLTKIPAKVVEGCEQSSTSAEGSGSSGEVTLTCHLRTINSEFDKVNLNALASSSSIDSIVRLSLLCSDILFYQSSLPPSSFLQFTKLQALSIEHCKLSRLESGVFNGLYLRNLTINTYNTAWPALSLDLSPELFSTVPTIERIDLSQNNIWTFPNHVFCPVSSLEYLNVSMNRLQDIGDLGFREKSDGKATPTTLQQQQKCKMNVQILDISHNRLILLPPSALGRLQQLKELYLQGNEISVVGTHALQNLRGLRILNLADNKVASLPEELFHDSRDITEIYFQNNSLTALSPRLFSKLNQLVILDLSHNRLSSLWMNCTKDPTPSRCPVSAEGGVDMSDNEFRTEPGLFSDLIRLVLLNLGYNQLTRLVPESFQNLYSLQILNLDHNQIQTIEPNTFSSMNNLHTLILSHNLLTSIDSASLNGLFVLSQLSIDNNKINSIHRAAFRNCTSLKDLNVNGNLLSQVDDAIQNLTLLKTIDLGENQLESTPHLLGLPNLYGLRLTGNRIVNVSKDEFKDLQSLKILNLARNQLKTIEEGAFDSNQNLQALRLDANYLTDISNLFAQSPNLIWLNISDNQLTWFDYALIPKQLQWIDVHKNSLNDLGNYFQRHDLRLQTLDASFNRISHIGAVNLPDSLEMIFLNDNLIKTIEPHTFYKKQNLSRVDIFANQIETLELTSLRLGPIPEDKQLPEMYLAGNPIVCDCNSEWLQRMRQLDHLRQHFKVIDLDSVYCRILNRDTVLPLSEVKPSQFLCPYTNHCFNLCECCEYNACDCQQQCPHNCDCFNDDVWSTNIVDCSGKGHTKMPLHIPMDASQLYLDGNTIDELPSHVLIGRKNLQILHLNDSRITRIANNSLSGLKRLSVLHLENNYIQRLEGFEFKDLTELRELFLQNNRLQYIANDTFHPLVHLEVLKLEHNRLTHFEMWTLSDNSFLIEINLAYNQWSCDCAFLAQAAPWVQSNVAKLQDAAGVNCRLHGRPFSLVYMNGTRCADLTALSGAAVEGPDYSSSLPSYLPLLGLVGAICLLFGGLIVVVCKSSGWILSKCGRCHQSARTRRLEDDHEKLYDAYVCYSLKDESWVNQMLANELQEKNDPPYRLCLHYKFPVTAYISDTIVEAAESAARTIVVVSKNFIQNEWCRFEYKSTLHSALRGMKVIAIILGDLPPRDLDPDLRILLRTAIVISAAEKTFLAKLRAALPDPRVPSYNNTNTTSRSTISIPQLQLRNEYPTNKRPHHPSQVHSEHPTLPLPLSISSTAGGLVMNGNYHIISEALLNDGGGGGNGGFGNHFFNTHGHNHNHDNSSSSTSTLNFTNTNSSINSSSVLPIMFVPPYPPPNRPPPPFPTTAMTTPRRPPPEIPTPTSHQHQQAMWAGQIMYSSNEDEYEYQDPIS